MSEFDQLKGNAEQYAKDHPEQVHEGEQDAENAVESKTGFGDGGGQQDQGGQQGQATRATTAARRRVSKIRTSKGLEARASASAGSILPVILRIGWGGWCRCGPRAWSSA